MKEVQLHAKCQEEVIVDEAKLAYNVGSGIVSVYATPMMIAAMEHAAVQCLQPFLEEGETSVGVLMHTTHDAATPAGMKVRISAEIIAVDRKKVTFSIIAQDEKDIIGKASHERFVVMKEKFEAKAQAKLC